MNTNVKNIFFIQITIVLFLINCIALSRVRVVESAHKFDIRIRKSSLCVILFYGDSRYKNFDKKRSSQNSLLQMFENVSEQRYYDDADVTFIRVNSIIDGFDSLIERYGITEIPTIILLDHGSLVTGEEGQLAMLARCESAQQLHAFIKKFWEGRINILLETKERKRLARIKKENDESKPYFDSPAMIYKAEDRYWRRPVTYPGSGYGKQ